MTKDRIELKLNELIAVGKAIGRELRQLIKKQDSILYLTGDYEAAYIGNLVNKCEQRKNDNAEEIKKYRLQLKRD